MSGDLHARLLAEVEAFEDATTGRSGTGLGDAIRAVVELHRCALDEPLCRECWNSGAEDYEPWPCSTIRVIAEHLGVPAEDPKLTEKESPTNA